MPFQNMDTTISPYLLKGGVLSNAHLFIPSRKGGYETTPGFTTFASMPAGHTIIGMSKVGDISTEGAPQITIATSDPSGPALYQYMLDKTGTLTAWGMLFGGSQDTDRDRIVYHRMGGKEYTLGWDPDAYGYHCHLFESRYAPVGAEPMDASGVSAAASTSGGQMGPGYVRIYLAFRTNVDGESASRIGAPDLTNYFDVQLTGGDMTNKVTLSGLPSAAWNASPATTDKIYVYRTRVVSASDQLDLEAAYFETSCNPGAASVDVGTRTDAELVNMPQMELKYDFPSVGETGKFLDNLGMTEHLGRLMVWGVKYAYRLWISGYEDKDGVAQIDENWWGYSVDLPGRDTILGVQSLHGKCVAIGQNGLYVLKDDSADPADWQWLKAAELRGTNVNAMASTYDVIAFLAHDNHPGVSVFTFDGYTLKEVGAQVRASIDDDSRLLTVDGRLVVCHDTEDEKDGLMATMDGLWGRMNRPGAPTAGNTKWSPGRHADFQGGAVLLGSDDMVYYQNTTYNSAGAAKIYTRTFTGNVEDRTEWEKIYVFYETEGSANIKLEVSADGGAWADLGTEVVYGATSEGMLEYAVPASVRHARRLKARVTVDSSAWARIEGMSVQQMVPPEMV